MYMRQIKMVIVLKRMRGQYEALYGLNAEEISADVGWEGAVLLRAAGGDMASKGRCDSGGYGVSFCILGCLF